MRSLMVQDGDIVLTGGRLQAAAGQKKLLQDLSTWVRLPKGGVPTAPNFGSMLPEMIGEGTPEDLADAVDGEITRLLGLYQRQQLEAVRRDVMNGHRERWTTDEVLAEVGNVVLALDGGRVRVRVPLRTGAGSTLDVLASVTTAGVE